MKSYYKDRAEHAEKLLKLLEVGYKVKVAEIGQKIANAERAEEKEELVNEMLEYSDTLQNTRLDYKNCIENYEKECEKEKGNVNE